MFGLSWLTSKVAGIAGAVGAILLAVGAIFLKGQQAGVDKQKAKEAAAREEELDRIKHASTVKPIGGVSDDPNNRDNG